MGYKCSTHPPHQILTRLHALCAGVRTLCPRQPVCADATWRTPYRCAVGAETTRPHHTAVNTHASQTVSVVTNSWNAPVWKRCFPFPSVTTPQRANDSRNGGAGRAHVRPDSERTGPARRTRQGGRRTKPTRTPKCCCTEGAKRCITCRFATLTISRAH